MVTVLGSGLLVGTALAVIIPEGVHALYDNGDHGELGDLLAAGILYYFLSLGTAI